MPSQFLSRKGLLFSILENEREITDNTKLALEPWSKILLFRIFSSNMSKPEDTGVLAYFPNIQILLRLASDEVN